MRMWTSSLRGQMSKRKLQAMRYKLKRDEIKWEGGFTQQIKVCEYTCMTLSCR